MSNNILLLLFAVVTFGCDDIIEVEDISNTTVIILAPTNNAVLNNTTLTFSWEPIESAETYQIQIATPTFDEALQIVVDSTAIIAKSAKPVHVSVSKPSCVQAPIKA